MFTGRAQRTALILAAIAVATTVVLPPWKYVDVSPAYVAGYSWIWAPFGRSPCTKTPGKDDLDYVQQHPEAAFDFIRQFGCRPDQVPEATRLTDIAWNLLATEWAAILLVVGLVTAGLHRERPAKSASTPVLRNPVLNVTNPGDERPAEPQAAHADPWYDRGRLLGISLRTVAGKAAYQVAILFAWDIAATGTTKLLRPTLVAGSNGSAEFYALVVGAAQVFVAIFFLMWLRRVYKSEGGRVAALGLALLGLTIAAIGVIFWLV